MPNRDSNKNKKNEFDRIGENARRRLKSWVTASHGEVTQDTLAKAIRKPQNYISRYFEGKILKMSLDNLDAMAGVFGHTLCELLDTQPSTIEGELIENFRAMAPGTRASYFALGRDIVGAKPRG